MARVDSIILGGGIIGCALAEELARRNMRVMLLERGPIGAEASSAAAGILSTQMDVPAPGPMFELCQAARRRYPAWVKHLEEHSGLEVGFHVDGILYLAMTSQEEGAMTRQMRWQRQRGLRIDRWSPAQVRRAEPAIDGRLRCGFQFPTEAQVDNVILMRALAETCRRQGVELRASTAVRRIRLRGRSVRGIETDHDVLEAPVVVNCLGSWANMDGVFPLRIPVEPARGQILAFLGPKRLFRHAVMSDRGYIVQRRSGQLILGSTIERAGFEKALTVDGMHRILRGTHDISKALETCTFVDAWAGLRPRSQDGLPILGATPFEGLYVATGHFRHGILLAPITATLLADLILDGRSSINLAPFAPTRFRR